MSIDELQLAKTLRFLRLIVQPDEITELFIKEATIPGARTPVNFIGFYDFKHLEQLARDAVEYSGNARGIYFQMNPVNPELLSRSPNRLAPSKKGIAANRDDILKRRLLLIDVDPLRAAEKSASEQEKQIALAKLISVRDFLNDRGWPYPITCDSGNGYHLIYGLDLPCNDDLLVQRLLRGLSDRFSDQEIKIDTAVYDPARLARLPGTMNCKGDATVDRAHRLARVKGWPKKLHIVPRSKLEDIAGFIAILEDKQAGRSKAFEGEKISRARNYVRTMQPAVSGNRGHDQTFKVACRLIINFELTPEEAWPIFEEYNGRCIPPWSEKDLRYKLDQAASQGEMRKQARHIARLSNEDVEPYLIWEPLPGPEFIGWVPDFRLTDRKAVLVPLDEFREQPWWHWFEIFTASSVLHSHPLLPDVFLRQIHWGADWPKNWLRDLKTSRGQSLLEPTRTAAKCRKAFCFLSSTSIHHRHFETLTPSFGLLEHFVATPHLANSSAEDDEDNCDDAEDDDFSWCGTETNGSGDQCASKSLDTGNGEVAIEERADPRPKGHLDDSLGYIPPTEVRCFGLYDEGMREKLTKYKEKGIIAPVYWPALLFGSSRRVGWTTSQIRLLLGIVREVTRTKSGKQTNFETIHGNKIVPGGRGSQKLLCPHLDSCGAYVTFGGNKLRHGKGYKIVGTSGHGWLDRAGYSNTLLKGNLLLALAFLNDLTRLTADLDLIVIGYNSRSPTDKWRNLEEMRRLIRSGYGREWLGEATIRIFAPADWLVRWRYFFSKRLGFRWIPASAEDAGPTKPPVESAANAVDSPEKLRCFMARYDLTQSVLADVLTTRLSRPVSRQLVGRHLRGTASSDVFYQAVSELAQLLANSTDS